MLKTWSSLLFLCFFLAACAGAPPPKPQSEVPSATIPAEVKQKYQQAQRAMSEGRLENAGKILKELTESHPKLAGPWANLGIVYRLQNEPEASEQALKRSLELNPQLVIAQNHLAVLYRGQGRFSEALEIYSAVLKQNPDDKNTHYNLAILYELYLHRPKDAIKHYKKYMALTGEEDEQVQAWISQLQQEASR